MSLRAPRVLGAGRYRPDPRTIGAGTAATRPIRRRCKVRTGTVCAVGCGWVLGRRPVSRLRGVRCAPFLISECRLHFRTGQGMCGPKRPRGACLYRRLTDLPVTSGSHVSHAILLDCSRTSKHFWARARIGLWRGVRDRLSTVSTTVHHTLNAVARVKSVIMLQHDHRSRSLCNRIYYGASTHVPLHAQRLLRFASDLDGYCSVCRICARVVWVSTRVKTAMEN